MPTCNVCYDYTGDKSGLRRHYREEHPGEPWPDEEGLGAPESEQRDFAGEEPDESEHDPEPMTENEPPETERASLEQFEEES